MSEDKNKPVVIKTKSMKAVGRHTWSSINSYLDQFTRGIEATKLSEDEAVGEEEAMNITNAISGLPSAWARANMFVYAMRGTKEDEKSSGLFSFYASLIDEWRGMISSFVLTNASNIRIQNVELTAENDDVDTIYNPKATFGNVLFKKKQIWEDQSTLGNADRIRRPEITIIYYKDKVVGAASPESLCFTAPNYRLDGNEPFIHEKSKRFVDPLKTGRLSNEELKRLYSYVTKIQSQEHLGRFYDFYKESMDYLPNGIKESIYEKLGDWQKDIEAAMTEKGLALEKEKPEVIHFSGTPFAKIFNCENVLFINKIGKICSTIEDAGVDATEFNPKDLLIADTFKLAMIKGTKEMVSKLPVHLLTAESSAGPRSFTIPLSEVGFRVFENSMVGLLSGADPNGNTLSASFDPQSYKVAIQLQLMDGGRPITSPITKEYAVQQEALGDEQLIVWPDFVSKYWNKYYFFSEIPHDDSNFQAFPIIGDNVEGMPIMDNDYLKRSNLVNAQVNADHKFVTLAENGTTKYPELGRLIVGNIKNVQKYPYEIYESKKPFKGVQIKFRNQPCGSIFLNFDEQRGEHVKNMPDTSPPQGTRVGMDFGSNNSCFAFFDGQNSQLLKFQNRRVSLLSSDDDHNLKNKSQAAATFEMLFFQNDETWSNKIKSVLTLHEESRLIKDDPSDSINLIIGDAVKGGALCFEGNVAIKESSQNRHRLDMGKRGLLDMAYNMKWSYDQKDQNYLKCYLQSLLLIAYAELFTHKNGSRFPNKLVWAYPSAMSGSQVLGYSNDIWANLSTVNPLDSQSFGLEVVSGSRTVKKGSSPFGDSSPSSGGAFGAAPSGGGAFGAAPSGGGAFGSNPSSGGAFGGGNEKKSLLIPLENEYLAKLKGLDTEVLKTDTETLDPDKACTESEAIAQYAAQKPGANNEGDYMIGFDVGGSTTDILVLTSLKGQKTLVKQNSLKIAAGAVAEATSYVPGFANFLQDFAQANNMGNIHAIRTMSQTTVPFCFNQIVDSLDDDVSLNKLYGGIASSCKPLMWLNLYITGLNIFYAGMISRKLRTLSENTPEIYTPVTRVALEYFGKGSRIYDWFKAVDPENAKNYHVQCFIAGYGPEANAHLSGFNDTLFEAKPFTTFLDDGSDDVKVEVAKGLAIDPQAGNQTIQKITSMVSEIIGEDGYALRIDGEEPILLNALSDVSPALIQRIGSQLVPPRNGYPRFQAFLEQWFTFSQQCFGLNVPGDQVIQAMRSMNVTHELMKDEDFKKAQMNAQKGDFDFSASLFSIQARAFMKTFIIPLMQKG